MSSGKRKCPFSASSPQQMKTHITLRKAANSNDQLMKEMTDRTRTLLLTGQQRYWQGNNKENTAAIATNGISSSNSTGVVPGGNPAVAALPVLCYTCNTMMCTLSSIICAHCSRVCCGPCTRQCAQCSDVFCTFCSILNYEEIQDRAFCLSCRP